jgi:sporulation protein YlmC with PRC-barrel domain
MLKNIMAVTAVSALALTSALAQTTAPAPATPPAATAPSATAPTASTTTVAPAGKATFVTTQAADQHLASKFNGTDVIGTDDAKIGDVSDVLFDKDKKVIAFIVGVGGFLGIGAKDVAIDPASFQPVTGKDATDVKLRLSMTKDELKAAPAFEPYQPPRPVSSEAPASRPAGSPAPASPTMKQ